MRIAIFHDFLVRMGGAEDVLAVFLKIFPDADVYSLFVDEKNFRKKFPDLKVTTHKTSQIKYFFLSKIPIFGKYATKLFLSSRKVIEQFDFSDYDLVIANSGAWSHGLITSVDTKFVVYMHSPMRFVWDYFQNYKKDLGSEFFNIYLTRKLSNVRLWDTLAEKRDHLLICNSKTVAQRIQKFYRKEAEIVYPPVRVEDIPFDPKIPKENYYLIISTLAKYKNIHLAITYANKHKVDLIIAGDGPYKRSLQKIAGKTVHFLGFVDTKTKHELLQKAKAVVYTSEEDFGIVPIEAAAAGTLILAYGKGGSRETVRPHQTGILFEELSLESFENGMVELQKLEKTYDPNMLREHSKQFSEQQFIKNIRALLAKEFTLK